MFGDHITLGNGDPIESNSLSGKDCCVHHRATFAVLPWAVFAALYAQAADVGWCIDVDAFIVYNFFLAMLMPGGHIILGNGDPIDSNSFVRFLIT